MAKLTNPDKFNITMTHYLSKEQYDAILNQLFDFVTNTFLEYNTKSIYRSNEKVRNRLLDIMAEDKYDTIDRDMLNHIRKLYLKQL